MKIVVCIKHVPDTETKVKVGGDGRSIDETGVKWVISPYDEYALEEALLLKERVGDGEIVAVCAGREASQTTLRQALAMGADRAVLVSDARLERADAVTRAKALAGVIGEEKPDLVFLGKYGVGGDEGQVGPMLGALLDLPHAGAVDSLAWEDGRIKAERAIEGGVEVLEGAAPAVVTWGKTSHEPRYASLKGIMAAKRKPLELKAPSDVGVDDADLDGPSVVWESIDLPPPRPAGRVLEGETPEQVAELVRLLRDEAKVI